MTTRFFARPPSSFTPSLQLERHSKGYYGDFSPAAPTYNAAVAAVLGPALVILAMVGGAALVGAAGATLLLALLLDRAGLREASLLVLWAGQVWLVLALSGAGLGLVRHAATNLFVLLHGALVLLSAVAWVSLQHLWFVQLLPGVAMVLERLLFGVAGLSAAAVVAWAATVAFGVSASPYALWVVLHVVYSILWLPRPSAFRRRVDPDIPDTDYFISSYPESALLTLVYVALPCALHAGLYHGTLWHPTHLANLALLVSLSLLGLRWLWPHRPLWFLERAAPRLLERLHSFALWFPAAVVPLAVCERVLLPTFVRDLALPHPLGPLLIVAAAYAITGAVVAHHLEWLGARHAPQLRFVAAAVALGACAVVNAPLLLYPCALACALSAVSVYAHRRPGPYALCILCATVCMAWFFAAKLSFVHFHFARLELPLTEVLGLLSCCFVGAFLLVGVLLARPSQQLADAALAVYSCAFAVTEWILAYGHEPEDLSLAHELYPEYLVLATSLLGALLCRTAHRSRYVSLSGALAAAAVWVSKTAALLGDNVSHDVEVPLSVLLVLWACVPILSRWQHHHKSTASLDSRTMFYSCLGLGLTLQLATHTLPWSVLPGDSPFGAGLLVWGVALLAVALRFYPSSRYARGVAGLVAVAGALLWLLAPPTLDFASSEWSPALDPLMSPSLSLLLVALALAVVVLFPTLHVALAQPVPGALATTALGLLLAQAWCARFVTPLFFFLDGWNASTTLFCAAAAGAGVLCVRTAALLLALAPESRRYALSAHVAAASALFPVCFGLAAVPLRGVWLGDARAALLGTHCVLLFALALALAVMRTRAEQRRQQTAPPLSSIRDRDAKRAAVETAAVASLLPHDAGAVGTAAAAGSLACAYALGLVYLEAPAVAVAPLCALLLLVASPRRYAVALGACVATLLGSALLQLSGSGLGYVLHVLLLLASAPSAALVTWQLTVRGRRDMFTLLLLAPPAVLVGFLVPVVPEAYLIAAYVVAGTVVSAFVLTSPIKMRI